MQTNKDHTSQDKGEKFSGICCYQASCNCSVLSTSTGDATCCPESERNKCSSYGNKPTAKTAGQSCEVNVHSAKVFLKDYLKLEEKNIDYKGFF